MKSLCAFAMAASYLFGGPINLVEGSRGPAVMQLDIQRIQGVDPNELGPRRARRRQSSTVPVNLDNQITTYLANCSIGTPPQRFQVHLDTGSSDLWVVAPTAAACTQTNCSVLGAYYSNVSSTYHSLNNSRFATTYADGSNVRGYYAKDTLSIGGVTLPDFQFGIGYNTTEAMGVLGIGYPLNEAQLTTQWANKLPLSTYPNLPEALLDSGKILSNAYSLWLNDLSASMGSILFGGIDTEKYVGNLSTLPIVPSTLFNITNAYLEFVVALTGLGIGGAAGSISSSLSVPVLLDSGSSLTYLPDAYTQKIYDRFNVTYDSNQGAAIVNCSVGTSNSSIDFTFFEPTISVSINQMVLPYGEGVCAFGILPAGNITAVLGDTFLRSAYVVYHLTNNEISIARTRFGGNTSNILEIRNGTNGVPGATRVGAAYRFANATASANTTSTSNAVSCTTTPSSITTPATTSSTTTPSTTIALTTTDPGYPCNRDNCLRAFIGQGGYPNTSFCNALTQAPAVTAATDAAVPFPSYATACGTGSVQASRISSACSCLCSDFRNRV